jgi:hypothetical protein
MWLHKPPEFAVPVLVPEHMPDTIKRALADGWTVCADPRLPVEATHEALMPSLTVPTDAASTAQVLPEPEPAKLATKPATKPTPPVKRRTAMRPASKRAR